MAARQRLADDRRRRQFKIIFDIDGRYIQESQTRDMRLRQNSVLREHNDHVVVDDGARQGHSRMQILDGYGFQSKLLLWETAYIMGSADKMKSSRFTQMCSFCLGDKPQA